ncbi:stalk domain-containing protein [Syntrophomonas palmitatica]|uniref:stalk domain-containing protein n=1 Tax=Syntrophomonas palmitatica TaxID=402877 RepID=UPI0006D2978E|nr:stalk domain-containing protein [Syntrophomonas palmitatica]
MKKKWMLLIAVVMLFAFTAGAVAGPAVQNITASLASDIKFTVKGNAWTPKDANGNTLAPIIYNGATYLPVRAVGDALGVKVDWNNDTRTVILGEAAAAPKTEAPKVEAPKTEAPKTEAPKTEAPKTEAPKTEAPKAAATPADLVKAVVANFAPVKANINVSGTVAGIVKVGAQATASIAKDGTAASKIAGDSGPLGKTETTPAVCPFSEVIYGPEAAGTGVVASATLKDGVISFKGNLPASVIKFLDGINPQVTWSAVTGEVSITVKDNRVTSISIKNGAAKVKTPLGDRDAVFSGDFTYTY